MAEAELVDLQASMLMACTGAGGQDRRGLVVGGSLIKSSNRLSAEERLDIYARGYQGRLLECLRAQFPVLNALVGRQVFGLFAKGYISACPPRSPSLFDLGAGFADYLENARPRPWAPPSSSDALPASLARLERARSECRRARGVETDLDHQPIDLAFLLRTPDATVRAPESLRLLRLDFSVCDTVADADRGDVPPIPVAAETFYAVARSGYRVAIHALAPWQHAFLKACGTEGAVLHAAAAAVAVASGGDPADVWAGLLTWLPPAVDAGIATVVAPRGD